jgi:probable rRNA maturation factor
LTIRLQARASIKSSELQNYARRIKQALQIEDRDFNLCFVDDGAIRELNATYRGKPQPTDVLSFPWCSGENGRTREAESPGRMTPEGDASDRVNSEFEGFLGDIVISVPAARRNAQAEGHSMAAEIRMLILHGVLHLLGYDHETDQGEMTAKELTLRRDLDIVAKRHGKTRLGPALEGSNGVRQRDRQHRS